MSDYRCERAAATHADELLSLFEGAASGCYCNYWYFTGDKNAWLERCYIKPEQNRAALVARLAAPELCGVVALSPTGSVVGWMNLSRAGSVPRLYDQRIYRGLPCFQPEAGSREHVYVIACCYVAQTKRDTGVGRALLEAAVVAARDAGGSALEALPRAAPEGERLRPDEVWLGPEAMFIAAGFAKVSDFRPYPVLRLHLR